MITKTEYIKALEVVEEYHNQLVIVSEKFKKTKISDWLEINKGKMSSRLYNVLMKEYNTTDWINATKYVEDIDKRTFTRIRNAGLKSWHEFLELQTTTNA